VLGLPPFFHCFGLKAVLLTSVLYGAAVTPMPVFDVRQAAAWQRDGAGAERHWRAHMEAAGQRLLREDLQSRSVVDLFS